VIAPQQNFTQNARAGCAQERAYSIKIACKSSRGIQHWRLAGMRRSVSQTTAYGRLTRQRSAVRGHSRSASQSSFSAWAVILRAFQLGVILVELGNKRFNLASVIPSMIKPNASAPIALRISRTECRPVFLAFSCLITRVRATSGVSGLGTSVTRGDAQFTAAYRR
jgi:hypothetical protein